MKYVYGQLLAVFMNMLDDKEKTRPSIVKISSALRRVHFKLMQSKDKEYYECADKVEYAIKQSFVDFPEGKNITINAMCWLIQNRYKDELKFYKLNHKHFEAMSRFGVQGYAMQSAKVLNNIEKYLKEGNDLQKV